jgi:hypothetical protein
LRTRGDLDDQGGHFGLSLRVDDRLAIPAGGGLQQRGHFDAGGIVERAGGLGNAEQQGRGQEKTFHFSKRFFGGPACCSIPRPVATNYLILETKTPTCAGWRCR